MGQIIFGVPSLIDTPLHSLTVTVLLGGVRIYCLKGNAGII